VPDGSEDQVVVEPPDPFEGGELDALDRAPGAAAADDFRLEETDDGLSQGVVVAVALELAPPDGSVTAYGFKRPAGGAPRNRKGISNTGRCRVFVTADKRWPGLGGIASEADLCWLKIGSRRGFVPSPAMHHHLAESSAYRANLESPADALTEGLHVADESNPIAAFVEAFENRNGILQGGGIQGTESLVQ